MRRCMARLRGLLPVSHTNDRAVADVPRRTMKKRKREAVLSRSQRHPKRSSSILSETHPPQLPSPFQSLATLGQSQDVSDWSASDQSLPQPHRLTPSRDISSSSDDVDLGSDSEERRAVIRRWNKKRDKRERKLAKKVAVAMAKARARHKPSRRSVLTKVFLLPPRTHG